MQEVELFCCSVHYFKAEAVFSEVAGQSVDDSFKLSEAQMRNHVYLHFI